MPRELFSQDEINHEKELIDLEMAHRPLLKMPGGSHMTFITERRSGRTVPVANQYAAVTRLRGAGELASNEAIAEWMQTNLESIFKHGDWNRQ